MEIKDFLEKIKNGLLTGEEDLIPLYSEYEEPEINRGEILRYAGIPAAILRARGEGKKDESYIEIPTDEELAKRKENWTPKEPSVTSGYLARYRELVTSGNRGAILEVKK